MAIRLVFENAVRYLNVVPAKKLTGLLLAAQEKATELGLTPTATATPAIEANQEPSGNMAGILRFVQSLNADSTAEDKATLAALLGVLLARTGGAGLVLPALAAPEAEATPERRGRRGRRAK